MDQQTDQATTDQRQAGALSRLTDIVRWSARGLRSMSVSDRYDVLGTAALTSRGLFLNLGYWRDAHEIDEACVALVSLVAQTAAMQPEDVVVDVGFGFGEQDLLWMERFAPRRIIGLNVTPSQVRIARHRVHRRGLVDRIDLRHGSATAMPLPDASCDVVTAVECAFHFDTRAAFFAEAWRVLRPGGRLVLADMIRAEPAADPLRRRLQAFNWRQAARILAISQDNFDHRASYADKLRGAGFDAVDVASIRDDVFPGWHRALRQDPALLRRLPVFARLPYGLLQRFDADTVYGAFDYVLASGRKPAVAAAAATRG